MSFAKSLLKSLLTCFSLYSVKPQQKSQFLVCFSKIKRTWNALSVIHTQTYILSLLCEQIGSISNIWTKIKYFRENKNSKFNLKKTNKKSISKPKVQNYKLLTHTHKKTNKRIWLFDPNTWPSENVYKRKTRNQTNFFPSLQKYLLFATLLH